MTNATPQFRISFWPDASTLNPYQPLFYESLKTYGVTVEKDFQFSNHWLRLNHDKIDAFHIHWPESLWRKNKGEGLLRQCYGFLGFLRFLLALKRFGIKLVWTVHNIEHHEGSSSFDRWGYWTLAKMADLLIVHSEGAANAIKFRDKPRAPVIVMPHGNYDGVYPSPKSKNETLAHYDLDPSKPLFVCIGLIRKYKGVEVAIEAIKQLDGEAQLLIAGACGDNDYLLELQNQIRDNPYIKFHEGFLDDQSFSNVVGASEAVLLPYKKITGSGALLAAWTLGRSVIASKIPYFENMADIDKKALVLFDPDSPSSLAGAMKNHLEIPSELRKSAARKVAGEYSWDRCVKPVASVLKTWIKA